MLTGPEMLVIRAFYSLATLYIMLILLRWLGPWLKLNFHSPGLGWIRSLTDPPISAIRSKLPRLGPFDFAPLVCIFLAWLVRTVGITILVNVFR